MARSGKLTQAAVNSAKPRDKIYRIADGRGLCLEVQPTAARYWRFRYRHGGKARMAALGVYPEVSLAEARERCLEARKLLSAGSDPVQAKRTEKARLAVSVANTFEAVAREWLAKETGTLATVTLTKARWMLEAFAFPRIGARPVSELQPPELLDVLRRVESAGKIETAHRLRSRCSQVFRYAIATHRALSDPTRDLAGALKTKKAKHRAALTDPRRIGELMRAIDAFDGQYVTKAALRLAPLVFVRPGELRGAQWDEIDLDAGEWRIPAERMKMRAPHIVPLSTQAVTVLRELQALTGRNKLVLQSPSVPRKPISENTLNYALRRMGFTADEMTSHGFRGMASTLLHEKGWASNLIERQLAHADRNSVRAAYNHAEYLDERRRMMQAWADWLDYQKSTEPDNREQAKKSV
jgi:integrase